MTLPSLIRSTLLASMDLALLGARLAHAQTLTSRDDSRSDVELKADVRQAVARDTDVANTALVFNNPGSDTVVVVCHAYGPNGNMLGRKVAHVPGLDHEPRRDSGRPLRLTFDSIPAGRDLLAPLTTTSVLGNPRLRQQARTPGAAGAA